MKTEYASIVAAGFVAVSSARELNAAPWSSSAAWKKSKREVPQEHSHRQFLIGVQEALELDNRFNIVDPVFSLLGNAAAEAGAGDVENLDCLQQIIADEAFTNAAAADDLDGMTNALIFRTLEKNTLTVGEQSVACDETAANPEVDALEQHQDPASDNADAINAEIELELARQLAGIGADPLLALNSATFPAGDIGDPTGAGNSCNDENDDVGCIFTENLLTPAVTEDEILAAVADADGVAAAVEGEGEGEEEEEEGGEEEEEEAAGEEEEEEAAGEEEEGEEEEGENIQAFAGDLGGAAPAVVQSDGDRPFSVNGVTFNNAEAALSRSCAVQNNACADAVNGGELDGVSVADCNAQEAECQAAVAAKIKMIRRAVFMRV